MIKTSTLGFPRIGEKRELKFALEAYWKKEQSLQELQQCGAMLRKRHWTYQQQSNIDHISINDFSFYDTMLDTIVMLGVEPQRFKNISDSTERYFAMARGNDEIKALEMTKWFNTNYHYLVPELSETDKLCINIDKIKNEYQEAKALGISPKINIIGPLTFLKLSKRIDAHSDDTLDFFDTYLEAYKKVVEALGDLDDEILIQFDEPHFVKDTTHKERDLLQKTYQTLGEIADVKIIVATYFEHSNEATAILCQTPIYGVALDFVYGAENINSLDQIASCGKKLFAGVVDGRNIWVCDLQKRLSLLEKIGQKIPKDDLVISSSCSLLHTPYTLKYEDKIDEQIKPSLSFAIEKLEELKHLSQLFGNANNLTEETKAYFQRNQEIIAQREKSTLFNDDKVKARVEQLSDADYKRASDFDERIKLQKASLNYPDLATTTIGSFPQTKALRAKRLSFKRGEITQEAYDDYIKELTRACVAFQEDIGLDVLVHGEFERNDMVEYFGERLNGFAFSSNAWVQSYGSRCVKPPIIYGDVSRAKEMTVSWSVYAQSLTKKIMKGMLTGPVTIMNWSFVRDDKPRKEVCEQIALAIRDEVDELQNSGIKIIQVDEAAFKEGYPLRAKNIGSYEKFALDSFLLSTAIAKNDTQIHTHMCYSEFNDIIKTIEAMDADVISIETARSGNELLKIFREVAYKQEVGPGVYDIHSPRVPTVEELKEQIKALLEVLPKEKLWINPDCGLKTRRDEEVNPSLQNMVQAVREIRQTL